MDSNVYKQLQKKFDYQLRKIQKLVDKKAEEIENSYYDKYYKFYDIAISVLRRHDVLMYGGTAINEVLPAKRKFYKKTELPDIDVFCTNYEPISKDIIEAFSKIGYSLTTVNEALHENTYKVMVEGLQLIDLTVIDTTAFENLKKGGMKTSFGIQTVNIDFLKYSQHSMLSQPFDSNRWTKVFQRIVRLYETFPVELKRCQLGDIQDYYLDVPKEIVEAKDKWAKERNLVQFGWDVIQTFIEEDKTLSMEMKEPFVPKDPSLTAIQYMIIDKDALKDTKEWVRSLNDKNLKVEHYYPKNKFMLPYISISYKGQHWMYIFESPICISFQEYKGKNILTIHSILRYLYEMYLTTMEKDIYCVIQLLTAIYINNLLSTKKVYNQFVINCYGFQKGLITLRKEKFMRQLKKKEMM